MMEELKTCPFCGKEGEMIRVPHYSRGTLSYTYYVKCEYTCCRLMSPYISESQAAEAWNNRVD